MVEININPKKELFSEEGESLHPFVFVTGSTAQQEVVSET